MIRHFKVRPVVRVSLHPLCNVRPFTNNCHLFSIEQNIKAIHWQSIDWHELDMIVLVYK